MGFASRNKKWFQVTLFPGVLTCRHARLERGSQVLIWRLFLHEAKKKLLSS
jgi:hypothetical protein